MLILIQALLLLFTLQHGNKQRIDAMQTRKLDFMYDNFSDQIK
ncbi:hypothetical protein P278_13390 [Zhouia amylolytica AD3]|uniref:Uncharacterized protein n=1 Tax=Zhouia amylolytica AD3 TaxID=1286632 RepID=W2UQL3_9FLAO|nr:hypothetical protein P278_13390 [Zhouia amylolytica AD3]